MKEKILIALKTKFKNLGFGDKAFEGVADYLATTITEEANIETGIAGVESLLKSFQGDIDKRVNEAVAKAKAESSKQDPPKNDPPTEDVPAWAKALIESNKSMTEKIAAFESGKTKESLQAKAEKALKDKGIPDAFLKVAMKAFNAEDEEKLNAFVSEVEADFGEFKQSTNDRAFETATPPIGSGSKPETIKKEIEGWAASKVPQKQEA